MTTELVSVLYEAWARTLVVLDAEGWKCQCNVKNTHIGCGLLGVDRWMDGLAALESHLRRNTTISALCIAWPQGE